MEYINKYATAQDVQNAVDNKELSKPYVAYVVDEDKIDWNSKDIDYAGMPLTFEITSPGNVAFSKRTDDTKTVTIKYKVNDGLWNTIVSTTEGIQISVAQGDILQFAGNNSSYSDYWPYENGFSGTTAGFIVYGNIMSMVSSENYRNLDSLTANYAFPRFFTECYGLTDASNLILPATSLTEYCYSSMFANCANLTSHPQLPAATLTDGCYHQMFGNCQKLNYIKCLATNISAQSCTEFWVNGIASTGTFVKKAGVTWRTGASGIPSGWTVIEE